MTTRSLDLGCGRNPQNIFNADELYSVDIISNFIDIDLACESLPFEDNYFDYVTGFNLLHQIPKIIYVNGKRRTPLIDLMNEVWRVLKPKGYVHFETPAYPHPEACTDPLSVSLITDRTIDYFSIPSPATKYETRIGETLEHGFTGTFYATDQYFRKDIPYILVWQLIPVNKPEPVSKKIKVVDCFPFFDEFTILDVRFREIGDLVDKFVIVESRETFNGTPKPLYLSECYKERYPEYADKIEIIVPDLYPNPKDAWDREYFQKNHICKENLAFLGLDDDDLILMSDADEIPRRKVVQDLIEKGFPPAGGTFEYKTFYYKFNVLTTEICYRSKYFSYGTMTKWKDHRYFIQPRIRDAGWHFSYIKSPEKIKEKIESFSHQEFNIPSINNVDNIETKIDAAADLFNRPEMQMKVIEIDDSFPEYVKENQELLNEWIYQKKDA